MPYADVTAPFKAAMQTLAEGKDTDQSTALLFARSMKEFVMRGIEAFVSPSIAAETAFELTPNEDLQFRTKAGGLIADMKNDPDWFSKVLYHAYKKVTPTTIKSAEEIIQAIGGDLSKSGVKRDLWDTGYKNIYWFQCTKTRPISSNEI